MRLRVALVLPALVVAGVLASPAAAAGQELELAQKYAPVVRIVKQDEPCEHGEAFEPIDVDLVLGNGEVALRGPWAGQAIVKVAPTVDDLSKPLFGYHLDFPGDALDPGCDYDMWERSLDPSHSVTYAHVVTDPAYPGRLALQYWFFYVFNNWNDKHEGDWEMIQLDFDARDAADALSKKPTEVGFSQHEGGERADWGADKLGIVGGTHPVVYPASGSHANYYTTDLHLGRSAAQGVGCDNTIGPSRDLRPEVVLLPTPKDEYLAKFPWLAYEGGWGEPHPSFYGGPTGPNTKTQWTKPITWATETWRDSAYTVPTGGGKNSATDFFCGAVEKGSTLLTKLVANPSGVLIALGVLLVLLFWLGTRTRWDEVAPFRLKRRRPWGSLITSGFHLYVKHPGLFVGIGLLFIPLALLIAGIQYLIFHVGGLAPLADVAGESNAFVAGIAFALGLFFTIFGLNVVQAATTVAMVELDEGREATARYAYRRVLDRLPNLLVPLVGAVIAITILGLTGLGVVVGAWLIVRWSFLPPVVMLGDPEHPLRQSARLVRGHWLRVASVTLFVTGPALAIGPFVGTLLLLLTPASFNIVNLVSGLFYMFTLPFAAIVTTLLYFDVRVRHELEEKRIEVEGVLPAEI